MGNKKTYQKVTEEIVQSLEEVKSGNWERPWDPTVGLPSNRKTGSTYSGVNVPLLWTHQQMKGYDSSEWLTYNQAQDMGGHVRKGESGNKIAFFRMWEKETVIDKETGEEVDVGVEEAEEDDDLRVERENIPVWKTYTVFNVEQCAGIEPSTEEHDGERLEEVQEIIENLDVEIKEGSTRAGYSIEKDHIVLPDFDAFDSPEDFYSTMFHELTHWSGHESRLDRDFTSRFSGDKDRYAFEELVAELGGSFLCAEFNVDQDLRDPAQYIDHWLSILKDDEYNIFLASYKAKEATEFIKEVGEK